MCCHKIQAVKAFHLKFKARLSWITGVLKIFASEFNCVRSSFSWEQLSLYIIWFRVSSKRKYYFMSETYLKPSQTSKMKLLEKVVNASRDVFRTVFSIQNVFRTSRMALFTKIMNGWKPLTFSAKSSILIFCWVLKMPLDSQSLTIFTKNCILDL